MFSQSLTFLLTLIASLCSQAPHTLTESTPEQAIERVANKLKSIKAVRYDYYRDVNYVSEEYRNVLSGNTYLDFQAPQAITGFRFQIDSETFKTIYDGTTLLSIDKKEKIMDVQKQPKISDFSSMAFLYNSIVSLRNSLDTIASANAVSKTLSDTTIDGQSYSLIQFVLTSQTIRNLGGLSNLTSKRNIIYKIIADKKTDLPVQVIQTNNVAPKDYVLTKFSNYQLNAEPPHATTWHYLTYANDYKPVIKN